MTISRRVAAALAAAALLVPLAACSDDSDHDNEYTNVCVNSYNLRVDERNCDTYHPYYSWYYYPGYTMLPGYGFAVPGGYQRQLPPNMRLSARHPGPQGGQVYTTRAQQKQYKAENKRIQKAQKAQVRAQQKANAPKYSPPKTGTQSKPKPPSFPQYKPPASVPKTKMR